MSDFALGAVNYKTSGLFNNPYLNGNNGLGNTERVAWGGQKAPAIKEAGHQGRIGLPEVEDLEAANAAAELFASAETVNPISTASSAFDADSVFAQARDCEVHPKLGGWAA